MRSPLVFIRPVPYTRLHSLAPADYHRFHSPVDAIIGDTVDIPGQYYTGASLFLLYVERNDADMRVYVMQ